MICVEMMRRFERAGRALRRGAGAPLLPSRTVGRSSSGCRRSPAARCSCSRCGGGWWSVDVEPEYCRRRRRGWRASSRTRLGVGRCGSPGRSVVLIVVRDPQPVVHPRRLGVHASPASSLHETAGLDDDAVRAAGRPLDDVADPRLPRAGHACSALGSYWPFLLVLWATHVGSGRARPHADAAVRCHGVDYDADDDPAAGVRRRVGEHRVRRPDRLQLVAAGVPRPAAARSTTTARSTGATDSGCWCR